MFLKVRSLQDAKPVSVFAGMHAVSGVIGIVPIVVGPGMLAGSCKVANPAMRSAHGHK